MLTSRRKYLWHVWCVALIPVEQGCGTRVDSLEDIRDDWPVDVTRHSFCVWIWTWTVLEDAPHTHMTTRLYSI